MKKTMGRMLSAAVIVVMSLLLITGCSGGQSGDGSETSLLWYIPIESQNDSNQIFAKANEYIKDKIGVTVDFVPISIGDYDSKIQIINAAKQKYDIIFTSNWLNNYESAVHNGTLYDITDMVKEYAPQTYANIPEKFWDGTKIDDKIYAVINQQIMARGTCICVPVKNKEMNVDYNAIKTWKDCSLFLDEYHKQTGNFTYMGNLWTGLTLWHGMDELLGSDIVGAYYINDDASDGHIQVINQFESPEFLEYIKGRREWVENGWVENTIGAKFDYDSFVLENGKDAFVPQLCLYPTYKPGVEQEIENVRHFPVETSYKQEGFVSRSGVTSTMTGIGAYSGHPDKALQLLELVNNDPYLMNLLSFGLEGINYIKNEDGSITLSQENVYSTNNWALGNIFNCYVLEGQSPDIWKETAEINEAGKVSELIGFVPDVTSITNEISNCTAAASEFSSALCMGVVDVDSYYAQFLAKLKAGGCDRIVQTMQQQVDEYLASRK